MITNLRMELFEALVTIVHPIPEFLAWCRDSGHTEEHFVHTLTMISNITTAGAAAELRVTQRRSFVSRPVVAATWRYRENATCAGRWRHSVCVYGAADIPRLLNLSRAEDGPVMANKFQSEVRCGYLEYLHRISTVLIWLNIAGARWTRPWCRAWTRCCIPRHIVEAE